MDKKTRILVCGGGNGAHALVALASTLNNVEVNVMTLFGDEAVRWTNMLGSESITLSIVNNNGTTDVLHGKPRIITNDPNIAMEDVDAIFLVVPAFAHQQYFDTICKHIKPNTIIFGMPGQAGFEFQAFGCLKNMAPKCAIVSFETLPWACRILEFGRKVQILGIKETLAVCVISGTGKYVLPPLDYAQKILGPKPLLKMAHNYIAVNLMATPVHPPILYVKWKNWDGKPLSEMPLFYQGVEDEEANILTLASDEVIATAKAIEEKYSYLDMSEVITILDWYRIYYSEQISDNSSLKMCMQTNKAYEGLVHPMKKVEGGFVPDFNHRYLSEDVPYGMVVLKGIAECIGVKTPVMDAIIIWAQEKLGKEYLIGSELKGKDVVETRAPQAYGMTTMDDLLKHFK